MSALLAWVWVGLDAALIFTLSSLSQPLPYVTGLEKYQFDKIFHVIEYGIFGWLLTRAICFSFPRKPFTFMASAAFFLGVLYGASDEWHQSFVPNRDSNPRDLVADTVGVGLGIVLWSRRSNAGN